MLGESPVDRTLIRRQVEQAALVALSQAALESIDAPSLLRMAVERVALVCGVEAVTIVERISETEKVIRADVGYPMLDRGVVNAVNVVIPSRRGTSGTLGLWTQGGQQLTREDAQFAEVIACLVGWVVSRNEVETRLAEAIRDKDRGLRLETALSRCARALLGDHDPAAVELSLRALMEATDASTGFIDWHWLEDRALPRICLSRDGRSEELGRHWDGVSWNDLASIRRLLERGESTVARVGELPSEEAAFFLTGPELIMTELNVPIMVKGVWAGTIGLGDRDEHRTWDRKESIAIEHFASLLSGWWEKRNYVLRLEEAAAARHRRIRLEKSVAAAAQLLIQSSQPGDLDRALRLLLDGTDTTSVFIERNVENDRGELCSKVVAVAQRPGSVYDPSYWDMMPWTSMPHTYQFLARGEVAILIPERMEGPEADTYALTPVKSEVDFPIMIDGVWRGLIGLADENSARDWSDEIQMLHTAAEMIAAFWGRIEAAHRLEEVANSKAEFIASISHELRTPLTAVVGLAKTMTDPGYANRPEDSREFMKIIADQAVEMAAIVEDLLVVARSNIGSVTIRSEEIDLVVETETASRGVRWNDKKAPEISGEAKAHADPLRVRQIIRNLLTNALRYGGHQVRVTLAEIEGWAQVRVMDDGKGIPDADRERIFRPFERAHRRQGQPASVGLGLTVSRQLAVLMGGSLDYAVRDDWSTFELRLPSN